jgi:hypothetical protein
MTTAPGMSPATMVSRTASSMASQVASGDDAARAAGAQRAIAAEASATARRRRIGRY